VKLQDLRLSFVDLQTTGSTPDSGRILEMAWCVASGSEEKPAQINSCLVKQPEDQPVPTRITMLTGITSDEMQRAISFDEASSAFLQCLAGSDDAQALVIHFVQFEKRFLEQSFPTAFPGWRLYCTHQIAARLFPNLPSRGIRGLAGYFGLCMEECKRAETHVLATFLIWRNLCSKLAAIGVHTLDDLDKWLSDTRPGKRTKYEYPLDKTIRLSMPETPGVYRMLSCTGDVLYVGKATSLRSRVNSYFRGQKHRDSRKLEMLTQTWNIRHTICDTVVEACLLEIEEIKRLAPPYNISMKVDDRPLLFYDADFSSGACQQSDEHPIGPFRSELIMDSFIRLWQSLQSGEFDPLMFFDELPQELLRDGFDMLLQRHGLSAEVFSTPRSLLALGLHFRRLYAALDEEESPQCESPQSEPPMTESTETTETTQTTQAQPTPQEELTPDDVADKYERLLMRAASSYRLAKKLTHLLDAIVEFEESGKMHMLTVANGQLQWCRTDESGVTFLPSDVSCAIRAPLTCRTLPWDGLTLDTFDRLRVLHTELSRIIAGGGCVRISRLTPTVVSPHKRKRPRAKLEGASAFS